MFGSVLGDLKYGARQLRRSPAFTLVAVLALGIGVGANITIGAMFVDLFVIHMPFFIIPFFLAVVIVTVAMLCRQS